MTDVAGPRRGPGRPAQISRDKIVEAVSLAENLDALTMRELAARLGVSHAALYRWVKNRDELFDLVSEVLVDRVLATPGTAPAAGGPATAWLAQVAWAMHDQFLALPGYATHLSRPHRHHAHSISRLRGAVLEAFTGTGVSAEMAEQSWHIFITCMIGWLAATENPLNLGPSQARFDLFLGTLLRGLPAREPGTGRPGASAQAASTPG